MKTIKVMSIIGLIWFTLLLITILSEDFDADEALGMALIALLYAIPYSVVSLIHSSKKRSGSKE
jgi:hypothetical protein